MTGTATAERSFDGGDLVVKADVTVPADVKRISPLVEEVMGVVRDLGCAEGRETDIEIALREALANAVIHGNRSAPDKRVSLRLYGSPDRGLFIAVRDEGEGFDPDNVPDPRSTDRLELPHGRGLFLMRALMDHASHRKGGREVVLWKEKAR